MKKRTKRANRKKKRRLNSVKLICWIVIPAAIIGWHILDGLGIYVFTTERMIACGAGICVSLFPFFSEITVKNFTIKKEEKAK